jgi:hypothetical protein
MLNQNLEHLVSGLIDVSRAANRFRIWSTAAMPPTAALSRRSAGMKDMQAHLEKLRADAAECTLISDLATDAKKRELFARLADHLKVLAAEVERAIKIGTSDRGP